MQRSYCIYMLMNKNRTVLYVGVTGNLRQRIIQHYQGALKPGIKKAFTAKYNCYYCIAYECFLNARDAINRESEVKGWSREKKLVLAEKLNPGLPFLNDEILGPGWEEVYKM